MKITKRQLRKIIREEYHRAISESVKDIATEMQNYLDHLIRETSMSGRWLLLDFQSPEGEGLQKCKDDIGMFIICKMIKTIQHI